MKELHLFVYGTLVVSEVMEAVTGERFESTVAVLDGYASHVLLGKPYPALTSAPGETTSGRLYRGVPERVLSTLDRFEGELYERKTVEVQAGDEHTSAETYVLSAQALDQLGNESWDEAEFRRVHLQDFLRTCRRLRQGHGPP